MGYPVRLFAALVKDPAAVDDAWLASIDALNEADRPGRPHASKDVLRAGQAAVDRINAARRRPA